MRRKSFPPLQSLCPPYSLKLVLAVLSLLPLFGFPASTTLARDLSGYPPDIRGILERGVLRVAMSREDCYPFYTTGTNGELVGADPDMAREIAGFLGVRVEFDRSSETWDEIPELLVAGKADIGISAITITMPRAMRVLFTDPYVTAPALLIVNRRQALSDEEEILEKLHARALTVACRKGTAHVVFAHELFPKTTVLELSSADACMDAVLQGEAFAFFCSYELKYSHLASNPDLALRLKAIDVKAWRDSLAMAVPWSSTHLQAWLNLYLRWRRPNLSIEDIIRLHPADTPAKSALSSR